MEDAPKILIIESDETLLETLVSRFQLEGLKPQPAKNRAQATALLRALRFDAIVSEVRLPDGDGERIYRDAQAHLGSTPIIFTAGVGDVEQAVRLVKMDADYLLKPYDISDLIERLRSLILERGRTEKAQSLEAVSASVQPNMAPPPSETTSDALSSRNGLAGPASQVTSEKRRKAGAVKVAETLVARQSFATVLVGRCGLLREGLKRIPAAADFSIVGAGDSVDDVAAPLSGEDRPILLILDVSGDQDAIVRQVKLFREQHATARIGLLAARDQLSDVNMVAAFRCGANAYFLQPSCDSFVRSLELVMLGETILPPEMMSFILRHPGETIVRAPERHAAIGAEPNPHAGAATSYNPRLSIREKCILRCLIEGQSNKAIARKNDIAEATVKVHVKAILRKIRVSNRTQAAIWALNNDSVVGELTSETSSDEAAMSYSAVDQDRVAELFAPLRNGVALPILAATGGLVGAAGV
jgi:two-component system, NarL family, nitrate/nitrite response regulator NarL